MKLSRLLKTVSGECSVLDVIRPGAAPFDPEIRSIHYDSGTVLPGGLFVAIRGSRNDGHDFASQAVGRGAAAVVAERDVKVDAPVVRVTNSRAALALLSSAFYGVPASRLVMIGITGTNGKTTTSALIESVLAKAGFAVGVIGTGNFRYAGKRFANPLTTPESVELQKTLDMMEKSGTTHVVMEVSSHGLAQQRVAGCSFDVRVFTNLTQDHLDFHGNMDSYWKCKKLLFAGPYAEGKKGVSVINCNDPRGVELFGELSGSNSVSVGFSDTCMVYPEKVTYDPAGIHATVVTPEGSVSIFSPLAGPYNLENILCAFGVGVALGIALDTVKAGIEMFGGVPGRLERVVNNAERFVFVDYAHTPDALANVLDALGNVCTGRMICVFGCGGDRDREKRPLMGKIAAEKADITVVTSDNPRSEDPDAIINDIVEGMEDSAQRVYELSELNDHNTSGNHRYIIEPDRSLGIKCAVMASMPGDVIIIAGKGDETYQIFRDRIIDFDDRVEAVKALSELENRQKGRMCAM
ncbi:MAG: UDP-N-acetylmuramoyl-L-alanyl-D-glutamate--2,6-diaminopimelate ligase [Desulfococcus sp. 4484_241]|nr:MAG: UDP-N-acetylmuramoyl-L-alanyl-D-glutamate--2,6-diaminopimelate ligase [Desulfococcus sp. 4484_241]